MGKSIPDEKLLNEIIKLQEDLGHIPEVDDMREHGQYSAGPYYTHFESWNAALEQAGLDPQNYDSIGREQLVDELRRLAEELGRGPKQKEMAELGEYGPGAYKREFGSWNKALEVVGLEVNYRSSRPGRDRLLQYLQEFAEELDRAPKKDEMTERGEFGANTYIREFGSWNAALMAAGLELNLRYSVPEAELVESLQAASAELNRSPVRSEVADVTPFSHFAYESAFGSWNDALRSAGVEITHDPNIPHVEVECEWCGETLHRQPNEVETADRYYCNTSCLGNWRSENTAGENHPRWKGGDPVYGTNWPKQRERALKRDGFQCRSCGLSKNRHRAEFGQSLHVHHVTPIRTFEVPERGNELSNLVTLCASCHTDWEGIPLRPETPD